MGTLGRSHGWGSVDVRWSRQSPWAETRSHTAQKTPNNLNNAEFDSVPLFRLSVCCARNHVCLIQQEGSPLQGMLMRFSHLISSGGRTATHAPNGEAFQINTYSLNPFIYLFVDMYSTVTDHYNMNYISNGNMYKHKELSKINRLETYRQISCAWKQRCSSIHDCFHQPDFQSPVYSVGRMCPPFPGCNTCFLGGIHEDVHLQRKKKKEVLNCLHILILNIFISIYKFRTFPKLSRTKNLLLQQVRCLKPLIQWEHGHLISWLIIIYLFSHDPY